MGTNECSQPASKSSWDSQDFGDVNMVLKMVHFHKSSRPQWVNVDPFNGHPATFGHFDQNSVAILVVISKCYRFDQKGYGHFGFVVLVATLYLLCNKWNNTWEFFRCIECQTGLTIRDTRVVDVIKFPTNSLELWATVLNGFFICIWHK